jgi:UDP-3-O-[3-hydroxymyristoyl] glucosamine N-acyltransferase
MAITTGELAAWLNAELVGTEATPLERAARIEDAEAGSIGFVANPRYAVFAAQTRASALIVGRDFSAPVAEGCALLRVDDPYSAFGRVLERLEEQAALTREGIDPRAAVDPAARVAPDAWVGPYAVLEAGVVVEAGAQIHGLVHLGRDVQVGAGSVVHPGVVVYPACRIGKNCTLHAGAVIGSDGFGFAPQPDGSFRKIPQLGQVTLEDGVEIGANACIDRATLGSTTIRQGAKIDNLVQVAHNAEVGAHSVLAAQSGISGSTRLGMGVQVGGQRPIHQRIAQSGRLPPAA